MLGLASSQFLVLVPVFFISTCSRALTLSSHHDRFSYYQLFLSLDPDGAQCLLPQVYSEMESSWVSSLTN